MRRGPGPEGSRRRIGWRKGGCFLPLLLLLLVAGIGSGRAAGDAPPSGITPSRTLRVGVTEEPPFAERDSLGEWRGFAVDLWREIAGDLGLGYRFVELPVDPSASLRALKEGRVDLVALGIAVTPGQAREISYSYPYYPSALAVAFRSERASTAWAIVHFLLSREFAYVMGGLLLATFVAGLLLWLVERKENPEHFGGKTIHGIGSAFWWAAVTMTTIGYGDKVPRTPKGRAIALVWMFVGVVLVSFFTAWVTAAVAVEKVNNRSLQGRNLEELRLGCVRGGMGEKFLGGEKIHARSFPSARECLAALAAGKIDAAVMREPALRYLVRTAYAGEIVVVPRPLERIDYAFALPRGSPLLGPINEEIIRRIGQLSSRVRQSF
ncbi:Cyclic nucleotide-gated potassium channel [Methylacidimicrobium cyclopophantes]|uniref:Cyclic nucleotide-gated potassium channel n=1 Tax=Methylacidimicrobium cyclopophantes TaxID=1041766 RepID=A0A5E6MCE4_9BACT|nr:transporter substrate-binding domain-containing protein [Methylacidimicrobium cyclopophantes]VVM06889.1 Cyclic nucleotide-gated potassium channel [Methylacidimicrobium cyclopophantes]